MELGGTANVGALGAAGWGGGGAAGAGRVTAAAGFAAAFAGDPPNSARVFAPYRSAKFFAFAASRR
jgi:hypothetical protein